MDLLDVIVYSPTVKKSYRNILVVIQNCSKCGWTVRMKKENAQAKKNSSENLLNSSRLKTNFNSHWWWKRICESLFTESFKKMNLRKIDQFPSKASVFA